MRREKICSNYTDKDYCAVILARHINQDNCVTITFPQSMVFTDSSSTRMFGSKDNQMQKGYLVMVLANLVIMKVKNPGEIMFNLLGPALMCIQWKNTMKNRELFTLPGLH